MDINLPQDAVAAVDEFMRLARMHHENIPGVSFPFLTIYRPLRLSFNDVDHFIVVVLVQAAFLGQARR